MGIVKIIETIGSSPDSWEAALKNAVDDASELPIFKSKKNITKVNVKNFDVEVEDNKIILFKCRVEILLE
ncbi:MAG TPA: dodecin domain-containing protein [Methanosarcinaceae archaeon]|nr:dodecin domain-containing protein [Methanosarcinaceae archaeon]